MYMLAVALVSRNVAPVNDLTILNRTLNLDEKYTEQLVDTILVDYF
jgi:hypothetical protein